MAGVKVISRETGETVELSSDEAQQAFIDERVNFQDGDLAWITPEGNMMSAPAAEANQALAAGWKLQSLDEIQAEKLRREEKTSTGAIIGAAEATASGATFGLSRLAEAQLGVDPQRMALRREAAGPLGTAGEIVGGAITGGALAKAGGLALSAKASKSIIPTILGGSAEGFAAGAGAAMDESILGGREITAERLVSGGLIGALLGGAGGALAGGLGKLRKVADGSAAVPDDSVATVLGRSRGAERGSDAVARTIAKAQSVASSADESALYRSGIPGLLDPKRRATLLEAYLDPQRSRKEVADAISSQMAEVTAASRSVRKELGRARKYRSISKHIDDAAAPTTLPKVGEVMRGIDDRLSQMVDDGAGFYGMQSDVRALRNQIKALGSELDAKPNMSKAFEILDNVKRDIDDRISPVFKAMQRGNMLQSADNAAFQELKTMRDGLREFLVDESAWGNAAIIQKDINAATSMAFEKERIAKELGLGKLLKATTSGEIDEASAFRIAGSMSKYGGSQKEKALIEAIDARIEQARVTAKYMDVGDEGKRSLAALEQSRKTLSKTLEKHGDIANAIDDIQHLRDAEGGGSVSIGTLTTSGPAIGASLGAAAFGAPGAVVGGAIGSMASRPYTMARTLAGLLNMAKKVDMQGSASVSKFFLPGKAGPLGGGDVIRSAATTGTVRARERHKEIRESVIDIASNPTKLERHLDRNLAFVREFAPGVAGAMGVKAARAMSFLVARLPPIYTPKWGGGDAMVSDAKLEAFSRYVETVEDPMSAIDRLGDGTLQREHVEALQQVYPAIYSDLRMKVTERMATAIAEKEDVPFWKRAQLGILFAMPVDDALAPARVLANQSIHSASDQQEQAKAAMAARPSNGKTSRNYMLGTEKVSAGLMS